MILDLGRYADLGRHIGLPLQSDGHAVWWTCSLMDKKFGGHAVEWTQFLIFN